VLTALYAGGLSRFRGGTIAEFVAFHLGEISLLPSPISVNGAQKIGCA
jgi:hypothetical protein